MSMEQFAALLAIAWSDAQHDSGLLDVSPSQQASCILKHTPEALEAWATALRTRFAGQKRAVCLEQSRGPLIDALLKHAFLVRYPINPATLATDRAACSPSQATADPREADYLLALLRQPRARLKAWRPEKAKPRTLQYLVEHRRRLVKDRTRIRTRVTALLKAYVPQV
jgi:hypothetical protein